MLHELAYALFCNPSRMWRGLKRAKHGATCVRVEGLHCCWSGGLHEGYGSIGATDNKTPFKCSDAVEGGTSCDGHCAEHVILPQHDISRRERQGKHTSLQPCLRQDLRTFWCLERNNHLKAMHIAADPVSRCFKMRKCFERALSDL